MEGRGETAWSGEATGAGVELGATGVAEDVGARGAAVVALSASSAGRGTHPVSAPAATSSATRVLTERDMTTNRSRTDAAPTSRARSIYPPTPRRASSALVDGSAHRMKSHATRSVRAVHPPTSRTA